MNVVYRYWLALSRSLVVSYPCKNFRNTALEKDAISSNASVSYKTKQNESVPESLSYPKLYTHLFTSHVDRACLDTRKLARDRIQVEDALDACPATPF